MAHAPVPSWETNVHGHAIQLEDYVVQALGTAFPRAARANKKDWISESTWPIMNVAADLRHSSRRLSRASTLGTLHMLSRAWKASPSR